MPQFFVRPEAIEGDRVRFDADEAHHLARVRRLRPGAVVDVTDGAGRVLRVRIDALGPRSATGTLVAEGGPAGESPLAVTLAAAVLKGDRMAWLIQKATELGVARIWPMLTARVVARPAGPRLEQQRLRWARVAREATKQCGRAVTPDVRAARPFAEILTDAGGHDAAWLCWEGGGPSLATRAPALGRPRSLLLLVGPEGGFEEREVREAEAVGIQVIGLGPRILRAESAGLVALALCQYEFGDLGRSPREAGTG